MIFRYSFDLHYGLRSEAKFYHNIWASEGRTLQHDEVSVLSLSAAGCIRRVRVENEDELNSDLADPLDLILLGRVWSILFQ
jgi:hypothetical protein